MINQIIYESRLDTKETGLWEFPTIGIDYSRMPGDRNKTFKYLLLIELDPIYLASKPL